MDLTNQVYNLADFVNKILIGMIVYAAAKMDTKIINSFYLKKRPSSEGLFFIQINHLIDF